MTLTLKHETEEGVTQDFEGLVSFNNDEPPHGQLELIIDPAKVDDNMKSDISKRKELVEGKWSAFARATIDEKKSAGKVDKIQASSEKALFKIEKKPLRTLIIASAGSRDFQFLFNQLNVRSRRFEPVSSERSRAGRQRQPARGSQANAQPIPRPDSR